MSNEATPPPLPQAQPVVMPPQPPPTPLGWGKAVLLCVIFYALTAVVGVVQALAKAQGLDIDGALGLVVQFVFAWPLTLWISCIIAAVPAHIAYPVRGFPRRLIAPVILSGLGLSVVLSEIAGWIPMPEFIKETFMNVTSGQPVWRFIGLVVLPPIAEEMFFRGLLLREFVRRYSVRHAIFGTAILFTLFHLNPWQGVVAFPLGLVAAWLVLRTGSLLPAIALHATINFTSLFLLIPLGKLLGYTEQQIIDMPHVPWPIMVPGALCCVAGLVWLWRTAQKLDNSTDTALPADTLQPPN